MVHHAAADSIAVSGVFRADARQSHKAHGHMMLASQSMSRRLTVADLGKPLLSRLLLLFIPLHFVLQHARRNVTPNVVHSHFRKAIR